MNEAYIPFYKNFILKKNYWNISKWCYNLNTEPRGRGFSTHKIQAARMEQWQ